MSKKRRRGDDGVEEDDGAGAVARTPGPVAV